MQTIAMMEIVSAVYVSMSLIGQFLGHDQSKSMKQIRVCSLLTLAWLLSDALTYLLNGPEFNYWIMNILCLLAYTLDNAVLIEYMRYCDSYFSERIKLNPLVFRIPIYVLILNTVVVILYYVQGRIVVFENGVLEVVGTIPVPAFIVYLVMLLYSPVIALINRREIGMRVVLFFTAFGFPIVIAIIIAVVTEYDLTVVMGGISAIFLVTFLQNESVRSRLEEARISAETASKAKTNFLFSMSHDIRTPMNAILGYADIALRHSDNMDRVNDSIHKIKLSGGHLLNLINDILEMSRIESGRLELAENPLNIFDAINSVTQMSRSLAISKDIEFITVIGKIDNPYVMTDELHVNEILINLISNAVKYNREGGRVEFNIEQLGEEQNGTVFFRFVISDNGIGMSEEFQKHLFEDFAREQTSTVSKQEGAGLGLSIVKRIVDMAGGIINVTSKKDEGSSFSVALPMKVMDEETQKSYIEQQEKKSYFDNDETFAGKNILLVEDNDLNREIASEMLEEVGMNVDEAEDGEIAVRMVSEKGADYYDYILMDIQMPVMNGYEATAEIRNLPKGEVVPIIALSANAFQEDVDKSRAVGMNAHVAKPINTKLLFETMHLLTKTI